MGRSEKYSKSLHEQAYDKLTSMQAFGESKRKAKDNGTDKDKIFSYNTYKTYWQQARAYVKFVQQEHPNCSNLKKARPYVREWLEKQVTEGKSAWTIQTAAKALGKLYGISPDDKDYFIPPVRHREDITRSRGVAERKKHFSESNNAELIAFCRGTGARREGLSKMTRKDLMTRDQIDKHVAKLEGYATERDLTEKERTELKICKDAQLFSGVDHFVYLVEKGGKARLAPVVGKNRGAIVERIRSTPKGKKVWEHVHSAADIHGYRADYAATVYRMYARDIKDIPYDGYNAGTKHHYQKDVYHCRKDEKGRKLDKRAMSLCSKALGHNRIDVVAGHYLRGI